MKSYWAFLFVYKNVSNIWNEFTFWLQEIWVTLCAGPSSTKPEQKYRLLLNPSFLIVVYHTINYFQKLQNFNKSKIKEKHRQFIRPRFENGSLTTPARSFKWISRYFINRFIGGSKTWAVFKSQADLKNIIV